MESYVLVALLLIIGAVIVEYSTKSEAGNVPSHAVSQAHRDAMFAAAAGHGPVTPACSPVSGRVAFLLCTVGEHVEPGQTLAVVVSREIEECQRAFLASLSKGDAAIQADWRKLRELGMSADAIAELERSHQVNGTFRILAGAKGKLLAHYVSPGEVVEPEDCVFEIANQA